MINVNARLNRQVYVVDLGLTFRVSVYLFVSVIRFIASFRVRNFFEKVRLQKFCQPVLPTRIVSLDWRVSFAHWDIPFITQRMSVERVRDY